MSRRIFPPVLLSFALAAGLAAQARIEPFVPPSARAAAMGGSHVAIADDFHAILENPAGMYRAEPVFFVSHLGLRLSGPILDIASTALAGESADLLASALGILEAGGGQLYVGGDLAGPLSFGYVGRGLGFGVFNRTRVVADARSLLSVKLGAAEDLVLVGGYAFGFGQDSGHTLDFGIVAKGFVRGEVSESLGIDGLLSLLEDPLGAGFRMTTGIGLDVGLLYSYGGILSFGLSLRDAYSPALAQDYADAISFAEDPSSAKVGAEHGVLIPPNLRVGLAFEPRPQVFRGILDEFRVALDYNDLLDLLAPVPRNPVLNVGIGAETTVLDILTLRVGLAQGLLSAGVALDLDVFAVNASVWGSELGLEPGERPLYNLMISLEFRL